MNAANMTDADVYLEYAIQFHAIDVHLQDLVDVAAATDPSLIGRIMSDWKTADLNKSQARLKLFAAQSAALKSLTSAFVAANKAMRSELEKLKATPERITNIASAIDKAVSAGSDLIARAKNS